MKSLILSISMIAATALMAAGRTVTGTVVNEDGEPMEWANVVLMCRADSSYITGGVTDAAGTFSLVQPDSREAMVKASYAAYKAVFTDVPADGAMGQILLTPRSVELGEVVVKADLPATAIKGNALVTTVENSILAHAGTANDVLTQVPMVLGRDGSFEVFGKGSPAIYINGRPVRDTNELAQLSSADIKSVEVITNPGSRYDASVKSVIRIRTRRPQGDGWSTTLRSRNGFRHYFQSVNNAYLKYRNRGLELFAQLGVYTGRFYNHNSIDMLTVGKQTILQQFDNVGRFRNTELYAKAGFSYMINDRHSLGAYYSNGMADMPEQHDYTSSASIDGKPYDHTVTTGKKTVKAVPQHYANLYYNGQVERLGIDLNMDYMWNRTRTDKNDREQSNRLGTTDVLTHSTDHNRMFAEKLVLSYPLWKGGIEVGEEYTSSRRTNDYTVNLSMIGNATSTVDESNIAAFVELQQKLGRFELMAGLRYEHVKSDYTENGQLRADMSRRYDNIFPSLGISAMIGKVQTSLSYSHKTARPNYRDLDGTITYVNNMILEGGNPYLQPSRIQSVELMGAWRWLFAKLSYSYIKDPSFNTSRPYGDDGEVKLLTMANFPHNHMLEAFVGTQFKVGIWQPKVNLGLTKQWLTIDYQGGRRSMGNPSALVQWQNAIHLPWDTWLNIDLQWMSAGDRENVHFSSSSELNAKLYKAFLNNTLRVTLEANDIFNRNHRDQTLYNNDVTLRQLNGKNDTRSLMLTIQYTFNATRDRYRGQGAGQAERARH